VRFFLQYNANQGSFCQIEAYGRSHATSWIRIVSSCPERITWLILCRWKVNNETAADQVVNAIKAGYRLFDCAQDYGNETECGQGVRRAIKEGLVKREELFIVTKVWSTFHGKHAIPSIRRSLDLWGLDYFDLVYIHFPIALEYVDPKVRYPPGWAYDGKDEIVYARAPLHETWGQMEKAVEQGLTRHIGISNYTGALILDLFSYARIPPSVLQIEHHPYLTQPRLLDLAKEKGIAVTGYSSFGPQSFIELQWEKTQNIDLLFENPVVVEAARAHRRTPAQVLLRWATQRGVCVIPKSNNPKRLIENLDVCSFDLTQKELDDISALNKGFRFNDPADEMKNPIRLFA